MVPVPKRITLVVQVADALRRGISAREWRERLPAEKDLAEQLQVSRMTLRAGIRVLAREGIVEVAKGRRTQIAAGRRAAGRRRRPYRVGVVTPMSFDRLSYGTYFDLYRSILQRAGLQVEFHPGSRFYASDPAGRLEDLVREAGVDFWVLAMSTAAMQGWFARREIPALVDGSRVPGVRLPALDIDYFSLCRHAAGMFLGLGHRRIVYLSAGSEVGGDLASEQGFSEGCRRSPDAQGAITTCRESADSVGAALTRLFRTAAPPTAILAGRTGFAFATLTYLMNKGLRVPGEVSLISRDDNSHFDYLMPALARYIFRPDPYAKRLARMTLKHFDGTLLPEQQLILPVFAKAASLGPCPAA